MIVLTLLLLVFITLVYLYSRYQFNYWIKKGVTTLNPITPAGDVWKSFLGIRNQHIVIKDCYNAFKEKGVKFGGLYFTYGPVFFPIDIDLIKRILQTDFDYFQDRGMYHDKIEQPLSEHIFSIEGENWKNLRQKLLPTFSSGKLKKMYPTILKYCESLISVLKEKQHDPINVPDMFKRYTMDVVLNCFFGIEEFNIEKGHTIYMDLAGKISNCSIIDLLKVAITSGTRNPGNLIKVVFMDPSIYEFFKELMNKIINYRLENNIKREDFVNYLLEIVEEDKRKGINPELAFDLDDLLAQVLAFFTGGYETTTFTLSACLYELALNTKIQNKLRNEIETFLSNNEEKIDYYQLNEMTYLDQIITETVRKHSIFATLNRYCVKDYKIPDTDVIIEKGTPVMISVCGIHHDPDYFPNPDKFDPDRFADKGNIPYMIGFGGGPRYCIGRRFGELQMKVAILQIVKNFKLKLNEKTGPTLEIDNITRHVLLQYKNTIWIDFEEIKNDG